MTLKPIVLYSHAGGPNPWKVNLVLEELGLPFETKFVEFSEVKKEPFISINPNGRVPAIEDPNTGITIWESGAILEYLVGTYDKSHKISSAPDTPEFWVEKQWLHFQMSGQGPYFGQAAWFGHFHHEKLPSAIERFRNEIKRVTSVLDKALQGKEYLVGGKLTYADLSFYGWQPRLAWLLDGQEAVDALRKEYPAWAAWNDRVMARPAVQKVIADQKQASGH